MITAPRLFAFQEIYSDRRPVLSDEQKAQIRAGDFCYAYNLSLCCSWPWRETVSVRTPQGVSVNADVYGDVELTREFFTNISPLAAKLRLRFSVDNPTLARYTAGAVDPAWAGVDIVYDLRWMHIASFYFRFSPSSGHGVAVTAHRALEASKMAAVKKAYERTQQMQQCIAVHMQDARGNVTLDGERFSDNARLAPEWSVDKPTVVCSFADLKIVLVGPCTGTAEQLKRIAEGGKRKGYRFRSFVGPPELRLKFTGYDDFMVHELPSARHRWPRGGHAQLVEKALALYAVCPVVYAVLWICDYLPGMAQWKEVLKVRAIESAFRSIRAVYERRASGAAPPLVRRQPRIGDCLDISRVPWTEPDQASLIAACKRLMRNQGKRRRLLAEAYADADNEEEEEEEEEEADDDDDDDEGGNEE